VQEALPQAQTKPATPAGDDEHDTMIVALRRAAVINAALLKLRRGQGGATPASLARAVDEAIGFLERAGSAIDIRSVEERLVATAFEYADETGPALPGDAAEEDGPFLVEAIERLRSDNDRFTEQVLDHSARMQFLATHADVEILRVQLSDELAGLRRAAIAKKTSDAAELPQIASRAGVLHEHVRVFAAHARFDALTGLYNRAAWDEQLTRLEAGNAARPAIAILDLDGLREINETSGRLAADAVLTAFGKYCKKAFGTDDFVARIGGDEFGVLVDAPFKDHAVAHVERLLDYVRRAAATPHVSGHLPFSVSAGLALADTSEGIHGQVARAGDALFAAKRGGRSKLIVAAA
jgi:diguanylate cyclase (GGDEF)-like protein